jgi:hypothetical protein
MGAPLLIAAAAGSFLNKPNGCGSMSPLRSPSRAACNLERFLKNRSRGRQATRTLPTAFPNSRFGTPPLSATGILAHARAYTPACEDGLRKKACSTAFPDQTAKSVQNAGNRIVRVRACARRAARPTTCLMPHPPRRSPRSCSRPELGVILGSLKANAP